MLEAQVVVDLLLKLVVRHGDSLSEGSSEVGFRFNNTASLALDAAAIARARDFLLLLEG
jgi:hypothetical protein